MRVHVCEEASLSCVQAMDTSLPYRIARDTKVVNNHAMIRHFVQLVHSILVWVFEAHMNSDTQVARCFAFCEPRFLSTLKVGVLFPSICA